MSRSSFRFGDTIVKQRGDVLGNETTSILTPTSTMHDILAARDVSSILRLAGELRGGFLRFAPPTQRDVDHAKRSVEQALLRGNLVGLRRRTRSAGAPSGGTAIAHAPPGVLTSTPVYFPPTETETPTWFEVTFVNELGQPLQSLDLTFSVSGRSRRLRTDARGVARVEGVEGSVAFVQPADWRALREALLRLPSGHAVAVPDARSYDVRAEMEGIQIYSELPCTVVLLAREELWIGIELLDKHGRPVAGAEYRLVPSRGGVIAGRLDSLGRARVVVAEPGSCTVTFPELDASITGAGSRAETSS